MALKKWNMYTNFGLDHSVRKKQDYLFRCPVAPAEIFCWNDLKSEFHLLPNRIFRKLFVNGKQAWYTRDRSIFWFRSHATLICTVWRLNFRMEVVQCERNTFKNPRIFQPVENSSVPCGRTLNTARAAHFFCTFLYSQCTTTK